MRADLAAAVAVMLREESSMHWEKSTRRRPERRRPRRALVLVLAVVIAASGLAATNGGAPATAPEILVLSDRADLISGGDALVEVRLPDGADPDAVRVSLDGTDITDAFAVRPNGRYQGLVTGLRLGENTLTAMTSRTVGATLTITNHPRQGPVTDGLNRRYPFICQTEEAGLGPATDEDCSAPTRYDFFYRSNVTEDFEDYDPDNPPAAALIATATTDQGKTVPFIVRRERGVVGRGIYDIGVLFDPENDADWSPWKPGAAWNGKLHWFQVGGCIGGGKHFQGLPMEIIRNGHDGAFNPALWNSSGLILSRGGAVITSSHNHCTPTTHSIEGTIITKEHFIETYGVPRFTSATGCSGGSGQVITAANGYPGLFDGLHLFCSVPDGPTVLEHTFHACALTHRYFVQESPHLWLDPADRVAVWGNTQACQLAGAGLGGPDLVTGGSGGSFADPSVGCKGAEWVYDPETNPSGVRCSYYDWMPGLLGTRPPESWGPVEKLIERGFTNRFSDNVGVQYGLVPLLRDQITPEQFVDLNEKVGGHDIDGQYTAERSRADLEGLRNLYRSELLNDASHLDEVPIMDLAQLVEEVHPAHYREQVRARMIAANGHADNHVRWQDTLNKVEHQILMGDSAHDTVLSKAWLALDRWLTAIHSDTSDDPIEVKVVRNKPADVRDTCWLASEPVACEGNQLAMSDPIQQAGGPLAGDVFKCQLKPIDWNDYGSVQFTDDQKRRLEGTFPEGVCDWSKPGVEQQPMDGTWRTYMDTVGGRPLGPAPESVPVKGSNGGRS